MNANVALWFSAMFPCVALAARRELPVALRGVLLGSATLLWELAVLGQSRGWLFTAPFALVLFIVIVPQRVRTVLTLGLVMAGAGFATPTLLKVYRAADGSGFASAVSNAVTAAVLAAIVAGIVGAAAAVADRRTKPSATRDRRAGRVLAVLTVIVAVAGAGVFVAEKGSPVTALSKAWHEFKTGPSPYGGAVALHGVARAPTATTSGASLGIASRTHRFGGSVATTSRSRTWRPARRRRPAVSAQRRAARAQPRPG